jgi:Domain of unknown function (DUF4845)
MRFRQRGVTFFGWLFLLVPWALVGYAGIRLAPVYLNYMKVVRALNLVESDAGSTDNPQAIRSTISKHFEIDMVDYPTAKDIKVAKSPTGTGWDVEASYDDEAPLFANLSMHVTFDKVVHAGSKGVP